MNSLVPGLAAADSCGWRVVDLARAAGDAEDANRVADGMFTTYPNRAALVRIRACGICATTDRELIRGTQPYHKVYPCLLGHEGVGQVVEVGARVTSFAPGDWVTRPAGIFPGETRDGLASAWGGLPPS